MVYVKKIINITLLRIAVIGLLLALWALCDLINLFNPTVIPPVYDVANALAAPVRLSPYRL